MEELTEEDVELIQKAEDVLAEQFEPERHSTSTAIKTKSGNIYTAVSLNTPMGKDGIHAEPIAIGQAVMENDAELDTSVAVQKDPDDEDQTRVVSACGICRELIRTYGPDTMIIVPGDDGPKKASASELLPGRR
jgi:cytidine deaminase